MSGARVLSIDKTREYISHKSLRFVIFHGGVQASRRANKGRTRGNESGEASGTVNLAVPLFLIQDEFNRELSLYGDGPDGIGPE